MAFEGGAHHALSDTRGAAGGRVDGLAGRQVDGLLSGRGYGGVMWGARGCHTGVKGSGVGVGVSHRVSRGCLWGVAWVA
jgi:hypothetical protein